MFTGKNLRKEGEVTLRRGEVDPCLRLTFPRKPVQPQCEISATFILIAGDLAMKRNRHTEEQVISIFKANERGVSIA